MKNFELKDKEESIFKNKKIMKSVEKFCYKLYSTTDTYNSLANISKVLSSFLEWKKYNKSSPQTDSWWNTKFQTLIYLRQSQNDKVRKMLSQMTENLSIIIKLM